MVKKYTELSKEEEQRAIDIHKKAVVINALSNVRLGANAVEGFQKYCDIMRLGGVTAVNLTTSNGHPENQHLGGACLTISNYYNLFNVVDDATLIRTAQDIQEAKETGKAGIILGFQGTTPIVTSQVVSNFYKCWGSIELFYNLGVRIIQLTYSRRARTGDGCFEITDCGLSRSGIDVIEGMNKLGILLDLSHCGSRTTLDAIEVSKDPVAFTHSGARSLNDLSRLKSDEEIKALAEKEGVIGIIAESNFVKHEGGLKEKRATLEDMLDHIDYVCDLVGVDHVGIGGDIPEVSRGAAAYDVIREFAKKRFEEVGRDRDKYPDYWYMSKTYFDTLWVKGFETIAETLNVTRGLVARSYSNKEILKIQGSNFLRLFEKVWRK